MVVFTAARAERFAVLDGRLTLSWSPYYVGGLRDGQVSPGAGPPTVRAVRDLSGQHLNWVFMNWLGDVSDSFRIGNCPAVRGLSGTAHAGMKR